MQDWAMTEKFAGMGTAGLDYNRQSLCNACMYAAMEAVANHRGGAWMHVPVTGGNFSQKFLGTTVLIMHKINSLKCSNNVVMICDCIKGNIL